MVFPNRNTIGLIALLMAMWYAGASQNNAAAYLLAFVLAGIAAISAIHAAANVRGVTLTAEPIRSAFAGDQMCVHLTASARTRWSHPALRVQQNNCESGTIFDEIGPGQSQRAELSMLARRRGRHELIKVQLSTLFPLGFFTARRTLEIRQTHIIYPRAEGSLPLPHSFMPARQRPSGLRVAADDFAGARPYQPGESQRHIDWKAAARGHPLLIKQWAGEADDILYLDWDNLAQLERESRLSQLARWVLVAERKGASYGLRLPELTIAPSRGDFHFHACLRALALHNSA
jgi:uncharacterized protein (DUF58 family)